MPLPKRMPRAGSAKKNSEKRILANRYRVEKKLGSGNFGTAWLVTDLKCQDPKEVLKVLKEISVGDLQPDETVDAMHEARLLSNLDHPGIVRFHDSFMDGEFFCIICEYCEGGDLDEKIQLYKKQKKQFPEALVVEWLIQLLLAIQYMHSRRVLHRDLKTRNIFLRNNMIKIGDFGISRILMGTTDMASTFTGTPYYMSPEVLKHEGYNSKSDVWSVGCILYEIVAQKHAFEGQSLMGVMYKIVEGNLPDLPEKYSEELVEVFQRMLEKDPAKRPSASEVMKMPFIENQMEKLKNTMMDKHYAKEQKDTINRESQQIVMAMKMSSNLAQLKRESDEAKLKNMSPRERMRLRKQMKADEEAQRLHFAAQQQLIDNAKKYQEIRENQNAYHSQISPWDKAEEKKARPGSAPVKGKHQTTHHAYDHVHRTHSTDGAEDSFTDFGDLMAQYVHTLPDRLQYSDEEEENDDDDDDVVFPNQLRRFSDDATERPITPLKDKMVYNLEYSSLDFKDGIPENPEMADTFYSQFEGDFEEEEEDEDDDDAAQTVIEKKVVVEEEEEDEAEGTLLSTVVAGKASGGGEDAGDNDVGDLINCMQNALDKSETIKSQTVADDTVAGAFGPTARAIKITNLRLECEKKLGKKEFDAAYEYLKGARFGLAKADGTVDEGKIMKDLRQIVKNPNDCFMVDQLLFLEEQAKLV